MTITWPPKPKPGPLSAPPPKAVTGPGGTVFEDCDTVAEVDKHIRRVQFQLGAHAKHPKRVSDHWQDLDALLERRFQLQLEAWLLPSDIPL